VNSAQASQIPTGPTISLFSEARLGRDVDGVWKAVNGADGTEAWSRFLGSGLRLRLVARAQQEKGTATVPLAPETAVCPLPYYVGPRQLASCLPKLVACITRAVVSSDVVVLRVPGVIGFLAAAFCQLTRRSYAVHVVGDPVAVVRSGALGTQLQRSIPLVARLMGRIVRVADASVFVTDSVLQGLYPPRPGTATIAVSDVTISQADLATRPRSAAIKELRIITVGSQEQTYKGHDTLLRAVRVLTDRGLQVHATIVGSGRMHTDLVGLASTLAIGNRVRFIETAVDRVTLRRLLDDSNVFAMPSRTEGLPRVLIEAMARALPAVGSAVGGIPELLPQDCLVPPDHPVALADVLAGFVADPALVGLHSTRNLASAQDFETSLLDARFGEWLRLLSRRAALQGDGFNSLLRLVRI